jgi:hypothetical protein
VLLFEIAVLLQRQGRLPWWPPWLPQ